MRDSADSDDYGVTRRGRKNRKFDEYEPAYAKRDRHLPALRLRIWIVHREALLPQADMALPVHAADLGDDERHPGLLGEA